MRLFIPATCWGVAVPLISRKFLKPVRGPTFPPEPLPPLIMSEIVVDVLDEELELDELLDELELDELLDEELELDELPGEELELGDLELDDEEGELLGDLELYDDDDDNKDFELLEEGELLEDLELDGDDDRIDLLPDSNDDIEELPDENADNPFEPYLDGDPRDFKRDLLTEGTIEFTNDLCDMAGVLDC